MSGASPHTIASDAANSPVAGTAVAGPLANIAPGCRRGPLHRCGIRPTRVREAVEPRLAGCRAGRRDSRHRRLHHLQDRRPVDPAGARGRSDGQGILQLLPPPGNHARPRLRPLRRRQDHLSVPWLALGPGRQRKADTGAPGIPWRGIARQRCRNERSSLGRVRRFRVHQPGSQSGTFRRVHCAAAPVPRGFRDRRDAPSLVEEGRHSLQLEGGPGSVLRSVSRIGHSSAAGKSRARDRLR